MTTLTLEQANTTLSSAGILLRLMPEGFDIMQKTQGFMRALQFCLQNRQAKQDVLQFLSPLSKHADLVVLVQDRNQVMPVITHQQAAQDLIATTIQNNQAPVHQQTTTVNAERQPEPVETHNNNEQSGPILTQDRDFDGHHVYGRNFALYFAVDTTKGGDATIAMDGAKVKSEKKYDWADKLRIQITRNDLPTVAAVFFGLLPECELKHYGACHSKRVYIKNQGENFFVNMAGKDKPQIAVPITASDVFEIRALFLQQLLANRPSIGIEGMLVNLKLHAHMLKAGATPRPTQSQV